MLADAVFPLLSCPNLLYQTMSYCPLIHIQTPSLQNPQPRSKCLRIQNESLFHATLNSYLPNVEGQCDGIKEIGVGTSCVNPEVPQDREEQGADDNDAAEDKNVPQD